MIELEMRILESINVTLILEKMVENILRWFENIEIKHKYRFCGRDSNRSDRNKSTN